MTLATRLVKQLVVLLAILVIFGGGGYGTYRIFNQPTPTPTPDPRDLLRPIEVLDSGLFTIDTGDYDWYVKVRNPNVEYGSPDFKYELVFNDAFGREITREIRSDFILPGESKYIVDTEVKLDSTVTEMKVRLLSADWQKLPKIALDDVNIPVTDVTFSLRDEDFVYGTVIGKVFNSSDYGLDEVDVAVLLYDDQGQIIAVNSTVIRTFLASTVRGFEISWFKPFDGSVKRVESQAKTNVFKIDNFIRKYGTQEKFQQIFRK